MKAKDLRMVVAMVTAFAMALVLALPAPRATANVVEHIQLPLEGIPIADLPCLDEDLVHTGGTLHVRINEVGNNNNTSYSYHYQPQGAKLVGVDSGDQWVGTGGDKGHLKQSLRNGNSVETIVDNFKIIGKGKATNLLIHFNLHTTTNANGELTASIDDLDITCR